VTKFHLDEFNGFFNATAHATRAGRRISTHKLFYAAATVRVI
jgi:hypothetical protein